MRIISRILSIVAVFCVGVGGSALAASDANFLRDPWPLTDIFETLPPRAHAQPGTACEIAGRYVDLVNAKRNDEIGPLFSQGAVFLDPSGRLVQGREAIGAWYARDAGGNAVIPVAFHAIGRECFMEAASHIDADPDPRFRLLVIDHFTLNEKGEIARAVYYFRPGSIEAARQLHMRRQGTGP